MIKTNEVMMDFRRARAPHSPFSYKREMFEIIGG